LPFKATEKSIKCPKFFDQFRTMSKILQQKINPESKYY